MNAPIIIATVMIPVPMRAITIPVSHVILPLDTDRYLLKRLRRELDGLLWQAENNRKLILRRGTGEATEPDQANLKKRLFPHYS
ncbi:hypothetical protein AUI06_10645 [archaeon 13_2_20CM_2_52_21]|nr:MAG: hypothetical protein AUI06_10645 [archaeon 13_2_20CM_2_52_21]